MPVESTAEDGNLGQKRDPVIPPQEGPKIQDSSARDGRLFSLDKSPDLQRCHTCARFVGEGAISKTSVSLVSPGSGLEGVEKGVGFDDPGFRSPPQLKPSAPAWTTVRQARQWAGGAVTAGRGLSVAPGRTRGAVGVGASGRSVVAEGRDWPC